jgi:hypothetical protein
MVRFGSEPWFKPDHGLVQGSCLGENQTIGSVLGLEGPGFS